MFVGNCEHRPLRDGSAGCDIAAGLIAGFLAFLVRATARVCDIHDVGRCSIRLIQRPGHLLCACLLLSVGTLAVADTLTGGGTGSSEPLLKILFEDFTKKESGHTLRIISPPLGSGGASKALLSGRIDLAVLAYKPAQDLLGKSALWFHLSDTPFILVTNDQSGRDGLSIDDIEKIYRGEIAKWKSGTSIRLILRASFDTDTKLMKSISAAMAVAVDHAQTRSGMPIAIDDQEALDMLTRVKGSLGPLSLGHLRTTGSSLQVVPIEGIMPSLANMSDGRYPWRKSLYVVLPEKPSPLAAKFAAYLRSNAAEAMLKRYGYLRGATP